MPLVVPGLMTEGNNNKESEWTEKLVGKKLDDEQHNETFFCKKELPESCRVIRPGQMVTRDHRPDRLNVHVGEDNTISHIYYG